MNHFETHAAFYNQVIKLTRGQVEQPLEVADLFLHTYDLADIRASLHHLQQVALTTDNYPFKDPKERDAIAWFCHDLEELLEAVWLLMQQRAT